MLASTAMSMTRQLVPSSADHLLVVLVVVVVVVVPSASSAKIATLSMKGWSTPEGVKLSRT